MPLLPRWTPKIRLGIRKSRRYLLPHLTMVTTWILQIPHLQIRLASTKILILTYLRHIHRIPRYTLLLPRIHHIPLRLSPLIHRTHINSTIHITHINHHHILCIPILLIHQIFNIPLPYLHQTIHNIIRRILNTLNTNNPLGFIHWTHRR